MKNDTPARLYALTPIDQTEGLEEGRYIVKNDYGMFEVSFDNKYQFNEEFTDCSDLTHYLRPLPPGTQVLPPGMVAVSERDIQDFVEWVSDGFERETKKGWANLWFGKIDFKEYTTKELYQQFIQTKLALMGE